MNELATRPSVTVELSINTIADLQSFCKILANTDMVPKAYKGKPDDILVAMLHGQEVGLPHLQALQSIAVVNGIPSIYGDAGLALVRASGKLEDLDEFLEVDGERQQGSFPIMQYAQAGRVITAVCMTKRAGMSRSRTTTYSVDDAGRAGLWGKAGPWTATPQRMLMWRARGWNLRDNFGDILKGLAIYEEAQDIETTVNERGVYTIPSDDIANQQRLMQVQEQLKAKGQEQASTGSEVPTSERSQGPPPADLAGGGPGHMTMEEWTALLLYLDASNDRIKVKNKAKAALQMKPLDKLQTLPPATQGKFVAKLIEIGKQEGVEIAF